MPTPAEGTLAPDFTLLTDTGEPLTLSSLRGRVVVLYFYPKDDTAGCTAEACEFRDLFPRFETADAVVLGISPDSVRKHRNFKRKYDLPFTLLADTEKAVVQGWDLWVEKLFWGRRYMGVARTTFVIDAKGRIVRRFDAVNPERHAAEVAKVVAKLRKR